MVYPLSYIPGGLREFFWYYIRLSKAAFARMLVCVCRGTTIRLSVDEGIDLESMVERDEKGVVRRLNLGERVVFISNHQVPNLTLSASRVRTWTDSDAIQSWVDWLYLWVLFYYAKLDEWLVVMLKSSLRKCESCICPTWLDPRPLFVSCRSCGLMIPLFDYSCADRRTGELTFMLSTRLKSCADPCSLVVQFERRCTFSSLSSSIRLLVRGSRRIV